MNPTRVVLLLLALACGAYLLFRWLAEPGSDAMPTRIEIHKAARELRYFEDGRLVRTFAMTLGFQPAGHKRAEGDGATPEGVYFVCVKNPRSKFHLSLGISYPGPRDAERGLAEGQISAAESEAIRRAHAEGKSPPWKTPLGGEIFIHGGGAHADWTQGCIALNDADVEALYGLVAVGTAVVIYP